MLANDLVRYAVLPPQNGSATPEEELALARFQFARIHGERAKSWVVRVSEGLACAVDAALLEGIKACFPKKGKARLASVQPHLMAFYNRSRKRIPREGAWLVLAERERTCVARRSAQGGAGGPQGRAAAVEGRRERERCRASGEPLPALVLTA